MEFNPIEILKLSKRKQMCTLMALIPLVLIANIKILQDIMCLNIPNGLKIVLNFTAIFLITLVLLDWRRKERSKEFKELEKEFEDKKIVEKITRVCNWKRKYPNEGEYVKQYNNPKTYLEFQSIHDARRDITEYYQKINRFFDDHLISPDEVKLLIPKNRIEILFNIIKPIEIEIQEITESKYDYTVFIFLDELYKDKLK